jgi:hypothetical protein
LYSAEETNARRRRFKSRLKRSAHFPRRQKLPSQALAA